ncbi:glycoside hydrolase family 97 catalytic domain-containing protein [Zobellia nedashkovskayae]
MERPLLINLSDSLYVAIGEAAQINYSRMKLNSYGSHTLQADIEGEVTFDHPFVSPWRFVMAGKTAGEILENNYLVLNLNEPNKIADTSWMKPGKVIRDLTLTTEGGKAYIDFAVKHNIQYVIESAGWYGNEFTKEADASTVTVDPERSTGPLDMPEVIRYGKEQGVDIMVYVNRNQLEKQLDDILPLYRSWGIKGIKYGFVRTGDQYWTNWMHEAVRKAADYEMVLSIHDDYRPVGYSRTYPNLMTMEGIRGDEESPSNEQTLMTMFTRMIAGAGTIPSVILHQGLPKKWVPMRHNWQKPFAYIAPCCGCIGMTDRKPQLWIVVVQGGQNPLLRKCPNWSFLITYRPFGTISKCFTQK